MQVPLDVAQRTPSRRYYELWRAELCFTSNRGLVMTACSGPRSSRKVCVWISVPRPSCLTRARDGRKQEHGVRRRKRDRKKGRAA
ncbi:hypothetical protein J3F84DRAFT_364596 [Trichoderma pleuroticola]